MKSVSRLPYMAKLLYILKNGASRELRTQKKQGLRPII